MPLISRFSRLFRADLHAVLDRIEEPVVLLKQAVREMQEEVNSDERNLKILQHELTQFPSLIAELEEKLGSTQKEIELCLDKDNDELARSVIRRKLELQFRLKRLQKKTIDVQSEVKTTSERLETNHSRLLGMQQKLEILENQPEEQDTGYSDIDTASVISSNDIEVALLKEKQARSAS